MRDTSPSTSASVGVSTDGASSPTPTTVASGRTWKVTRIVSGAASPTRGRELGAPQPGRRQVDRGDVHAALALDRPDERAVDGGHRGVRVRAQVVQRDRHRAVRCRDRDVGRIEEREHHPVLATGQRPARVDDLGEDARGLAALPRCDDVACRLGRRDARLRAARWGRGRRARRATAGATAGGHDEADGERDEQGTQSSGGHAPNDSRGGREGALALEWRVAADRPPETR